MFGRRRQTLMFLEDRGPLRVMFVITCMPVGGAETLLVNTIRRLDRTRFAPELCCLKHLGPLGDVLVDEIPTFTGLLSHKYDFGVWKRLTRLLCERRIDAVVTVGTGGDKMFWGRLAAWRAGVPVVLSSLHSTGLPDHVEFPNRLLAPLTDGFIAVAESHGRYLVEREGCPAERVFVIPNGVDTGRFRRREDDGRLRAEIGAAADAPLVGIVAALRPEKNHGLFLRMADRVRRAIPTARFVIVGDGVERAALERQAHELQLDGAVHFLGTRGDIPEVLSACDVFALSSHMEANPVSILEALACERPVVAPRVGSIPETVTPGENGFLFPAGDDATFAGQVIGLLNDRALARRMGQAGRRRVIADWSLERMVAGYQDLILRIYRGKCGGPAAEAFSPLVEPIAAPL